MKPKKLGSPQELMAEDESLNLENPEKEMTDDELRRELEKQAELALGLMVEDADVEEAKEAKEEALSESDLEEEAVLGLEGVDDKKKSPIKKPLPELAAKEHRDDFAAAELARKKAKEAEKIAPAIPLSELRAALDAHRPGKTDDPMMLLKEAQPPGVFFREDSPGAPLPELQDEALLAAVEEAKRLLREVSGIAKIVPGLTQTDEKAVVIGAERGFGEASLRQIPQEIQAFPTLLAIPYDLLPLRRER